MNQKKCLIVYYSKSGYTKKLAYEISRNIDSDIEEIKTAASFSGFFGTQRALFHTLLNREPKIHKLKHDPADYELVILGGPVWAGSLASPVRSFLSSYKDNLKNIAFFSTQGSRYGKPKVFQQVEKILKKNILANISVSDREIDDGKMVQKVFSFITELQGTKFPNIKKEVPKQRGKISSNLSAVR